MAQPGVPGIEDIPDFSNYTDAEFISLYQRYRDTNSNLPQQPVWLLLNHDFFNIYRTNVITDENRLVGILRNDIADSTLISQLFNGFSNTQTNILNNYGNITLNIILRRLINFDPHILNRFLTTLKQKLPTNYNTVIDFGRFIEELETNGSMKTFDTISHFLKENVSTSTRINLVENRIFNRIQQDTNRLNLLNRAEQAQPEQAQPEQAQPEQAQPEQARGILDQKTLELTVRTLINISLVDIWKTFEIIEHRLADLNVEDGVLKESLELFREQTRAEFNKRRFFF